MDRKIIIKFFILILIMMFIVLFNTTSYCEENYSVSMYISGSSQVSEGDTITLTANLDNVNAGNGVNAFSARLSFDSGLFEYVSVSGNNGWNTSFDPTSKSIIGFKGSKTTSSERVFTITLKPITGLSVESASVTIQGIEFSGGAISMGGTGDIRAASTSTSFSIIREIPAIEEEVYAEEVIEENERQITQSSRNLEYTEQTENVEEATEQQAEEGEQIQETQTTEQKTEEMPKTLMTNKNNNNNSNESFETIQVDKYKLSKSVKTAIGVAGIILVLILGYKLFQKTKLMVL